MKKWYESKTLWANIIGLIIVGLQYAGTINWIPAPILATILGFVNLVLRLFFTTTSLTK